MSDASQTALRRNASAYQLLRRFWFFARPHRRWIGIGMLMIPLVAGVTTLRPLLFKQAVDESIPASDVVELRLLGLLFMVAVVAEFLCQAVQVYALQRAGQRTITDLRGAIFRHVIALPARFFDRHPIGSLMTRTTSDVEALSESFSFGVFTILTDIVMIASIVVAMFVLDWKLTLLTLALGPILVLMIRWFSGALRNLQLEIRKAQAVQTGYLAEQLAGVTVVQLFGRERAAHREYERLGRKYLRATQLANIYEALGYSLIDGISAMAIAVLIYAAAPEVAVASTGITLGLLFAFIDYLQRIFVPIREFSGKLATIQRAAASLERIYGLLDEPAEVQTTPGHDPLATWRGGLRVRDLEFRYRPEGPDVLRGVSFDVQPGEVVAIVGRTGSGKSSLGRLLTQVYTGYRGSVQLDVDGGALELASAKPGEIRRHALMVQQDVFLFSADVAFNVALGDPGILDAPSRIEQALQTVQALDVVQARGGLTHEVGERGANLSAGEAQLIAFARVAARQPTLLILDEATASVDSMTEQKVQLAIERLFRGRTVLVIAHRLSTVRRADKILVFSRGRVAEQGRHEELMAKNGLYADLYRKGLSDDDPETPGVDGLSGLEREPMLPAEP